MVPEEVTVTRNNVTTIVKGRRQKTEHESMFNEHNYEKNERKFGEFTLTFKIPEEYERKWESFKLQDGVLMLKYKKDNDEVDTSVLDDTNHYN